MIPPVMRRSFVKEAVPSRARELAAENLRLIHSLVAACLTSIVPSAGQWRPGLASAQLALATRRGTT
jgi:hypothetical protein